MSKFKTSKTSAGVQFRKSVGSSIKSMFSNKVLFEIEHLTTSNRYFQGKKEPFSLQYIKIGRAGSSTIGYSFEEFPTVSNEHAAIEYIQGKWVLKHLSQTNPTIVNGTVIDKEYYLKDGDIIQFSFEGPKIKFHLPSTEAPNKISFSARTALMRQQIRMHKKIFIPVIIFLVIGIIAMAYIFYDYRTNTLAEKKELISKLEGYQQISQEKYDSLRNIQNELEEEGAAYLDSLVRAQHPPQAPRPEPKPKQKTPSPEHKTTTDTNIVYVYKSMESIEQFLTSELSHNILDFSSNKILLKSQKKKETIERKTEGVGFFATANNTNYFITTRQMIAPWEYFDKDKPESVDRKLNLLINNTNPSPEVEIEFTFNSSGTTFKNSWFQTNTKKDELFQTTSEKGKGEILRRGIPSTNYAKSNAIKAPDNIKISWNKSLKLKKNDTLYICALSKQGIVVDLCIFESLNANRINTKKCGNLQSKNGAPVIYLKRTGEGKKPEIYLIGFVTGWPDKSFIMPVKNFL